MMIDKASAEHYTWGGQCDGWHLVKSPNLSVIQERVPSGCVEVKHYHQKAEQFFFVLSGVATLEVAEQVFSLTPQQGLHVAAGVVHQLRNEAEQDLVFLVTSTPPSHGDRVEAV
ncbi:cupin domain-containing protein [Motilimonas cestriensis]|uniref:Cupin domain-containing protein n=1 Tax=Motilimonas cestriensis TaxID=2742685 RepID=A0ABS8WDI9_9GAMM|nr:cupin domain-containing protein [Motilimonas cestriensis]MCE2595821.1 cupin domain-containing protein [Motilimonas cestriensis]